MNIFGAAEPGPDSSMFMSMAWHAEGGRALYKDVWDHKPPLIFALDAVADGIGHDGVNSVRTMERCFSVVAVTLFFALCLLLFERFWVAYVMSLVFLSQEYGWFVIEGGNVTEEYGAVFLLGGILASVLAVRSARRRLLTVVSGASFALAVLAKEPFLLIVIPWFVTLAWPREGGFKNTTETTGLFLAGALTPVLAFAGYLLASGAWPYFVDSVAFNFLNEAGAKVLESDTPYPWRIFEMANLKLQPPYFLLLTAGLGLIAAVVPRFARERAWYPVTIAASATIALLMTALGGGFSGHYYLFFVSSFCLLSAAGLVFGVERLAAVGRMDVGALLALVLAIADIGAIQRFAHRMTLPETRWPGHELSALIRAKTDPGDLIWAPWKPLLYIESRRFSPTRWYFAFDHLFIDTPLSTGADKLKELRDDLQRRPPRVIVFNAPPGKYRTKEHARRLLARAELTTWIAQSYEVVSGTEDDAYQVLLWRGPAKNADSLVAEGIDALYKANDPTRAVEKLRAALGVEPEHYGAVFQLARALDAVGRRSEARAHWKKLFDLATAAHDEGSIAAARTRLATADDETVDGQMAAGLDCLYVLGDGSAAAQHFRKVLAASPDHYGATYQLARALDLEHKPAEATRQWRAVLKMAEAAGDAQTRALAEGRLQARSVP